MGGCVLLDCALRGFNELSYDIVRASGDRFDHLSIPAEIFPAAARAMTAIGVKVKDISMLHVLAATHMLEKPVSTRKLVKRSAGFYRGLVRHAMREVPLEWNPNHTFLVAKKMEYADEACMIALRRFPANLIFLREVARHAELMRPTGKAGSHLPAPSGN